MAGSDWPSWRRSQPSTNQANAEFGIQPKRPPDQLERRPEAAAVEGERIRRVRQHFRVVWRLGQRVLGKPHGGRLVAVVADPALRAAGVVAVRGQRHGEREVRVERYRRVELSQRGGVVGLGAWE